MEQSTGAESEESELNSTSLPLLQLKSRTIFTPDAPNEAPLNADKIEENSAYLAHGKEKNGKEKNYIPVQG